MNILIVPPNDLINNVLPNRLYHLARNWERRHIIYLLRYPHYPTSIDVERPLRRIDITPKARSSSNPGTYYVKNATTLYESLKRVVEREPIDVIIHANILPSLFAVKLSKKFKLRTIFDYLDHYPESASAYFKSSQAKWIVYTTVSLITGYNLRNSDEITTVSYTLKQMIEGRAKRPVHLIPNGVDVQLFKPLPKDRARKELSLELYDPILLYYGSIAEWMDYEALFKLVARLKLTYPNIGLILVGKIYKESEELYLKQKIKELDLKNNVVVHPSQPQEKIPLYISASDIVLAPYRSLPKNFGTPLKIIESLACERPVVASDVYEFKLWFNNYLEYYRTAQELIERVLFILKTYDLFSEKLKHARKYVEERFDWRGLAEKYEYMFCSLETKLIVIKFT